MKKKSRQGNPTGDAADFIAFDEAGCRGGIERILKKEEEYLRRRSSDRWVPANKIGLALSGGGIRSATFCLGVIQKLARAKWLAQIDYLSTVSGWFNRYAGLYQDNPNPKYAG